MNSYSYFTCTASPLFIFFIINVSPVDRRIEKEDLTSYIGKKREMFLLQVFKNQSYIHLVINIIILVFSGCEKR